MKHAIVFTSIALAAGICAADDFGRVISTTPVMQQVAVPRQVCTTQQVVVQPQQPSRSGAGVVLGALAGGILGHTVGGGSGKVLATGAGAVAGAVVGDRIEGATQQPAGPGHVQDVQQCSTQTVYENRPVAFNVLYEYAGKQYSAQMPNDPGPNIRLQIIPVGAVSQTATYR